MVGHLDVVKNYIGKMAKQREQAKKRKQEDSLLLDSFIIVLKHQIEKLMHFHQISWEEAKTLVLEKLSERLGDF